MVRTTCTFIVTFLTPEPIVLEKKKKHALLKARTQSPCFSYPGIARAFQSAGLADLSSFGGDSVGWPPDLLCWLPVYEWAKMRLVYLLIVGLTGFLSIFCIKYILKHFSCRF